jgi:hypothetical protein
MLSIVHQTQSNFLNAHLRDNPDNQVQVIWHNADLVYGKFSLGCNAEPIRSQRFARLGGEDASSLFGGENQMVTEIKPCMSCP